MGSWSDLIAVSLNGRLGNQLFQFAAGMARQRDGRATPVDSRWLPRTSGWRGELETCLQAGAVRELRQIELLMLREAPRLPRGGPRLERYRAAVASRFEGLDRRAFREAAEFTFDSRILDLRGPVILSGYFQDERYFADAAATVRSRFRPPSPATEAWFRDCVERAPGRPLIAIGFREAADYASLGWTLPDEYYRSALDALGAESADCAFAVFGDSRERNMVRARRLLGSRCELFSAHDLGAGDQLNAMAMFETLIIPNSTFSWWGAWLADFDRGYQARVLAPDPWLAVDTELVPDRWQKIPRPVGREGISA